MTNNFNITNITLNKFTSNNKLYTNINYKIFITNLNITLNLTKQFTQDFTTLPIKPNKFKNYLIDDHHLITNSLYNNLITFINKQY